MRCATERTRALPFLGIMVLSLFNGCGDEPTPAPPPPPTEHVIPLGEVVFDVTGDDPLGRDRVTAVVEIEVTYTAEGWDLYERGVRRLGPWVKDRALRMLAAIPRTDLADPTAMAAHAARLRARINERIGRAQAIAVKLRCTEIDGEPLATSGAATG